MHGFVAVAAESFGTHAATGDVGGRSSGMEEKCESMGAGCKQERRLTKHMKKGRREMVRGES